MIFYFSGCGDSRWVAMELADRLKQSLHHIPDESQGACLHRVQPHEAVGFVFPIHAWRPPLVVRRFVRRLRIETAGGEMPYTFMVCTCSRAAGNADKLLSRLLKPTGLQLQAAFSIAMPETGVNLAGVRLDDPQGMHQQLSLARTNLPLIANFLKHGDREVNTRRGHAPWLFTEVLAGVVEKIFLTDRHFRVEAGCTGCGKCVEACPMHDIALRDGVPVWQGHCAGCMACYHYCPANAIQWSRRTRGKGQYRYPDKE